MPVAAELQLAGHEVLWATATESCALIERYGFRAVPAGISSEKRQRLFFEMSPAGFLTMPVRAQRRVMMTLLFCEISAPVMRDDLIGVVERFDPDVVLHDLVDFAAAPVAAARGIAHATVAFGQALPPALLADVAGRVAHIWEAAGLEPSDSAGLYDQLYLHPLPSGFGQSISAPVVKSVRPMHFDGAADSDVPDWVRSFGKDLPGIYVTFGTEFAGLAPWSAVIEAVGALEADVVITLGSRVEPESLGAVPDNVRVERYVPQSYLLDHAAVVMSHGGSGTLFAAAARGIPQLSVPIAADQWDNADALVAAGAGLMLEPNERTAHAINDAVSLLLDRHSYGHAARALAEGFAALPHPRDHVTTIEALA